jgi:phosphoglycerate kinase
VAGHLAKLIERHVEFAHDCIGEESRNKIRDLDPRNILLLENLRYHDGEEVNDDEFAKQLAEGIDIFVQDGFGVVHRAHASTDAITHHLPSVAGLLLEKEVSTIAGVMEKPDRPLMALIGGAKISDKIDMLRRMMDIADVVAVGGAMANTFLLAEGIKIGQSKTEKDEAPLAKEILDKARAKASEGDFVFYVPQDGVVAKKMESSTRTRIVDWGAHVIAEIENYPKRPPRESGLVHADESIYDIGPFSGAFIAGSMQLADTVIWNGAMGVTEVEGLITKEGPFSQGTELVMEAMLGQFGHRPKTIVGGGDTVGFVEERGLVEHFYHVSTGGGASMDLMSGKKLPGVEALQNK